MQNLRRLSLLLILFSLFIVACGGGSSTAPEPEEEPAAAEPTDAPAVEEEPEAEPEMVEELECTDAIGCVEVDAGDPIRIASALVVTGPNESLGLDSQYGVEIAIGDRGELMGHPIELQAEDDGCSAEGGQTAGQKIVSDPTIAGVIGTSCSGAGVPMSQIVCEAGVAMISPSNTAPVLTGEGTRQACYFRTAHNDEIQGAAMANFVINELGLTKAAAIHDGDPYTEGLASAFSNAFEGLGGEIVAFEAEAADATNVEPLLTSVSASGPEIIFAPVFIPLGSLIAKTVQEIDGLEGVVLAAADGVLSPDFLEAAGDAAEGMYLSGPDLNFGNEIYDQFLVTYEANYGSDPISAFHAHAYDATNMLLNGIEAVAQVDGDGNMLIGRQALIDALAATQGMPGITGTISCLPNGDCADPKIAVNEVSGGEFNAIWAFGEGGGSADAGGAEGADVALTIWADDTRTPVIEELAADFLAEYGVGIEVQQVGFGDIREQIAVAGPAGEGPDIMIGAHDWLGELVTSGLVAELDLSGVAGDFSDAAIAAFQYDGVQYGLPYAVENIALFYNQDLIETPPATWSELKEVATALEEAGDVEYGYVLQPGDAYHYMPIQTAFGGYVFGNNADGSYNPNDVGIDSDGSIAAGQWLEGMIADGQLSADFDWDIIHGLFESGDAAMIVTGPWALGRIQESGVNYGIANLPGEVQDSQPFLGVQGFMVSAFSDDPLLAQAFLTEFVATEEAMGKLFASGDRPPAHEGVLASLEDPDLLAFGEAGVNGRAMPAIPEMGSVWSAWADAITLVFQDQQAADEAFGNAGAQIRAAIAGEEMPAAEAGGNMMEEIACEVDLTGETILIHQQAGREGPLAGLLGEGFAFATDDALGWINDNGGICGAELDIVFTETNYNTDLEVQAFEAYAASDPKPFLVYTYASGATVALKDRVVEEQIVNFAAGLNGPAMYDPANGYTIGFAPIYSDQFAGYIEYLNDNWDDLKPEGAGDAPVVGVVGWANAFGAGATTPEALDYLESIGVTVLPLEEIALDPSADASGQVQNLLLSGANVIWNQSLSFTPAQVIGAVRSLGVWDQVLVSGINWAMHNDVPNYMGDNAALLDGYCGPHPYATWGDTDIPGVALAIELFEAAGRPESEKSTTYLTTFGQFMATRDALIHAVNATGSAEITGADFLQALIDNEVPGMGMVNLQVDDVQRAPRVIQVGCWSADDAGDLSFNIVSGQIDTPDTAPYPDQ